MEQFIDDSRRFLSPDSRTDSNPAPVPARCSEEMGPPKNVPPAGPGQFGIEPPLYPFLLVPDSLTVSEQAETGRYTHQKPGCSVGQSEVNMPAEAAVSIDKKPGQLDDQPAVVKMFTDVVPTVVYDVFPQ